MSETSHDLLISYPVQSAETESNWRAMAQFWHPVATADEVADGPLATTLLDTDLVLYRTSDGVSAAVDMCPHRGAELSQGCIKDNALICPYHGLHFDGQGHCVRIPAENKSDDINPKLKLTTIPVAERYGLVWASLTSEPTLPLPDWSVLDSDDIGWASVPPEFWNAAAARHAENFNDISHVSWVHIDTFGQLPHGVPDYELERSKTGLRHHYVDVGTTQNFERHRTGGDASRSAEIIEGVVFDYRFSYPLASSMDIRAPDGRSCLIFDVIQPISQKRCRVYKIVGRNFDLDGGFDGAVAFEQAVNREDRAIIERLKPDWLPLDPAAEFPIKADRWSIAYRRALRDFGFS